MVDEIMMVDIMQNMAGMVRFIWKAELSRHRIYYSGKFLLSKKRRQILERGIVFTWHII